MYNAPKYNMKVLSQNEFWDVCCKSGFVLTGQQQGWIGNELFVTFNPPDVNFISDVIENIKRDLNLQDLPVDVQRADC